MTVDRPLGRSTPRRTALVTGANHGIGASTAIRLAASGADVVVTYLRHTNPAAGDVPPGYTADRARDASDVVQRIEALGRRALAIEADLADPMAVPMLFDHAASEFGGVDILVNNASGWTGDTFRGASLDSLGREVAGVSAESIERVFAIDARAAGLLIAEFARRLAARGGSWGRIIGLTSGSASGFPDEVSYGAAKAAQENYTMSAATELAPLGVTANVIHPPVTDTGWITDAVREFVHSSDEHTHVADADEVAEVIAWLCGDAARLISGNVIRLR